MRHIINVKNYGLAATSKIHQGTHMKKTLLSLLIGFGVTNHAFADDLLSVYQQALQNDPATLQSQANREAAFSDIEISRAGLLPQVSLSLQAAETYGDLDRSTNDVTLNLSQTIYDRYC